MILPSESGSCARRVTAKNSNKSDTIRFIAKKVHEQGAQTEPQIAPILKIVGRSRGDHGVECQFTRDKGADGGHLFAIFPGLARRYKLRFRILSSIFRAVPHIVGDELSAKRSERIVIERRSDSIHEVQVEVEVMDGDQAKSENFFGFDQVPDVSARECPASAAGALFFNRRPT